MTNQWPALPLVQPHHVRLVGLVILNLLHRPLLVELGKVRFEVHLVDAYTSVRLVTGGRSGRVARARQRNVPSNALLRCGCTARGSSWSPRRSVRGARRARAGRDSGVRNKASGRFGGFRPLPGHFRPLSGHFWSLLGHFGRFQTRSDQFRTVPEHFGAISDILGPFRRQVWRAEGLLHRKLN